MALKLQARCPLDPHGAAGDQAEDPMDEEGAGAAEEVAATHEVFPSMTHLRRKHHQMNNRTQTRRAPRLPLATAGGSNSVASCPPKAATKRPLAPMAELLPHPSPCQLP